MPQATGLVWSSALGVGQIGLKLVVDAGMKQERKCEGEESGRLEHQRCCSVSLSSPLHILSCFAPIFFSEYRKWKEQEQPVSGVLPVDRSGI